MSHDIDFFRYLFQVQPDDQADVAAAATAESGDKDGTEDTLARDDGSVGSPPAPAGAVEKDVDESVASVAQDGDDADMASPPAAEPDDHREAAQSPEEVGGEVADDEVVSAQPVAGLAIKNVATINESVNDVAGDNANAGDREIAHEESADVGNPEDPGENISEDHPMEDEPVPAAEPSDIPMESSETLDNLQEMLEAASEQQQEPQPTTATTEAAAANLDVAVGGDVDDPNLAMLSELEGDIGLPPGVLSDQYPPSDEMPF